MKQAGTVTLFHPPCAEGWLGNFGVYQSDDGTQRMPMRRSHAGLQQTTKSFGQISKAPLIWGGRLLP